MLLRFFLFVGMFWIVSRLVKILLGSFAVNKQSRQQKPTNNFKEKKPAGQMEFKDVQDAVFTEVQDKEAAAKQ